LGEQLVPLAIKAFALAGHIVAEILGHEDTGRPSHSRKIRSKIVSS
jgi:hypothetical protein